MPLTRALIIAFAASSTSQPKQLKSPQHFAHADRALSTCPTTASVMDIIDSIRSAVLQQREEEVTNFFTRVEDLRDFVSAREPPAGVNITAKMCCFVAERLSADNGSRVTLVNSTAHGVFDNICEDLTELNAINRKPFIAQITVWDAKKKIRSPKAMRIQFRPGAVYEFRQVHGVGFYLDIPKGSVQLEDSGIPRVVKTSPPLLKRKAERSTANRQPKARALQLRDGDDEHKTNEGSVSKNAPRTRSASTSVARGASGSP